MAKKAAKAATQTRSSDKAKAAEKAQEAPRANEPDTPSLGSLVSKNRMVRLKGNEKTFALEQMISCAARVLNLSASEPDIFRSPASF